MPSEKLIQHGDLVTIDIHPMVAGYLSDLALNAVVGPPSEGVKHLAEDWESLVEVLLSALRAGRSVDDVACEVEDAVKKRGLEEKCNPLYGHGLGTDARIPPVIVKGSSRKLAPNMMVEALLQLTDPDLGGMRLEVPVLLKEDGNEPLCKTPLKLHQCS
jgi:Xaa-Pro aminopeptidase